MKLGTTESKPTTIAAMFLVGGQVFHNKVGYFIKVFGSYTAVNLDSGTTLTLRPTDEVELIPDATFYLEEIK